MGILLPVITIGLMLATPYFSSKYFDVSRSGLKQADCRVMMIDLLDATVKIYADTDFHVDYKVNAFGFPNSKIRGYWKAGDTCRYTIQDMGWFTEVKNVVNLGIPVEDSIRYVVTVNHGKIICELPDSSAASFRLVIGKGDLSIAGHASVEYDLKDGKVVK